MANNYNTGDNGALGLPSNGLTVGTDQFVISAGNVGVGTASPTNRIQVTGTGLQRELITSTTTGPADITFDTGGVNLWTMGNRGTADTPNHRFSLYYFVTEYISVLTGGNVGIGVNNPTSKLAVGGSFTVSGNIGFFSATAAAQQTSGANLTNNVTSGGTTDTVANYTDLTIYANDAAAIRNDIYQLARKLKQVNDAMRLYGLLT